MTSLLSWGLILIADLVSIVFGAYSVNKIVKAYLDKKDLLKYEGYFVNAFLMIVVIPLVVTIAGLRIGDMPGARPIQVGIGIETNDFRGINGRISFSSGDYLFPANSRKIVRLNILNTFEDTEDFSISYSCVGDSQQCENTAEMLIPEQNRFEISPKVTFILPIEVNLKEAATNQKFKLNITINDASGSVYDSIPLVITVANTN